MNVNKRKKNERKQKGKLQLQMSELLFGCVGLGKKKENFRSKI